MNRQSTNAASLIAFLAALILGLWFWLNQAGTTARSNDESSPLAQAGRLTDGEQGAQQNQPSNSVQPAPEPDPAPPSLDEKSDAQARRIKMPEPLMDTDRRPSMGGPRQPTEEQAKALAELARRVPGAQADFDPISGTASWIRSLRGMLSPKAKVGLSETGILRFVDENAALIGHDSKAIEAAEKRTDYVTQHNGSRKMIWHQEYEGLEVFEAIFQANLTKDGELVNIGSQFIPQLEATVINSARRNITDWIANPTITALRAVEAVGTDLREPVQGLQLQEAIAATPEQRQKWSGGGLTEADARLVWLPMNAESIRLAWEVVATARSRGEMFRVMVDAESGEVLMRRALTADISDVTYHVYARPDKKPADSPTEFSPGHSTPTPTQPSEIPRNVLTFDAYNTTASPNGWIEDGGNETVGNNVDAHLDINADNSPDLPRPSGSPSRVFDATMSLNTEPSTYGNASVIQLFYTCNWIHDRYYELGFTEAAGNFQTNNFGRGGNGNDAVQADAQDGSGTNNANFSTPSDGSAGRMQMYLWTSPTPDRDSSFDTDIVIHEYTHGLSNRLVGGPFVSISAWQTRGMGEGWSDFFALSLLADPGDDVNAVYPMGAYSLHLLSGMSTNYYFGIRRYPYCTDMNKAPLTYGDIDPALAGLHTGVPLSPRYAVPNGSPDQYHAQGEVWCNMLWECRANLITKYGGSIGNETMLQLVTDGLKLAPANPTFIQARDAIIQADLVNNSGANLSELWNGFAKRGIGASASGPTVQTTSGVVEAYDIPDTLEVTPITLPTSEGPVGGPMAPPAHVFTLTNTDSSSLGWTASANVPWITLSSTSGTLAAGAATGVTATINNQANTLPIDSHAATVTFSNTTSGLNTTRVVHLKVTPYRIPIFIEPFDSPTLRSEWTVSGTNSYRTQVTLGNGPHAGLYHLTMDSSADTSYSRNEATITLDMTGAEDITLSFWAKEFNDEPDLPPSNPFINGADFDGVAISADGGTTWYEVQDLRNLTSTWQEFTVDLDAAMSNFGLSYGANFKIRFNQFDNFGITTDGIAIDDIAIARVLDRRLTFVAPASLTEGDGPATIHVTANVAPTTDLTVTLTASNGQASVPATLIIPAGNTTASFNLTATDDTDLDGTQNVEISASATGHQQGSGVVAIHDNEAATLTVSLPPSINEGTTNSTCTLAVSASPTEDVTVALESSDPRLTIPSSLVIAGETTSINFDISVPDDALFLDNLAVDVTATVTNWTSGTATITVLDDETPTLTLTGPATVREGDTSALYTVTMNSPLTVPFVVDLGSSDPSELAVPATLTIPAGQLSATVSATIGDDTGTDGDKSVILTASAATYTGSSIGVTVKDNDAHHFSISPVATVQKRNQLFHVTLTAKDVNDQVIDWFDGQPIWTSQSAGGPVPFTTELAKSFFNGMAEYVVTFTDLGTGVTLVADDGSGHTGTSNAFDIEGNPLAGFEWTGVPTSRSMDSLFPVTITAKDDTGAIASNYEEPTQVEVYSTGLSRSIGTITSLTTTVLRDTSNAQSRTQVIYTPEDMGGRASWLTRFLMSPSMTGGAVMNNMVVRIKLTDQTSFEGQGFDPGGWTTVYTGTSSATNTAFDFTTPFYYDGTSHLMLDFSFRNASASTAGSVNATATANPRVLSATADATAPDPALWSSSVGPVPQASSIVPNAVFFEAALMGEVPASAVPFAAGSWTGDIHSPVSGFCFFLARSPSGVESFSTRVSVTVVSAVSTGELLFTDPFDVSTTFGSNWSAVSTGSGRIQITAANTPIGTNHVTFDSSTSGSYGRNELTLTLPLATRSGVVLEYYAKEFADENNYPPPGIFDSNVNFDGVAISPDGVQWVEAKALRSLSSNHSVSRIALDPILQRYGWDYSSNFRIKWVQYDNDVIPTDGIAIDSVRVFGTSNTNNACTITHSGGPILEGSGAFTVTITSPVTLSVDQTVQLVSAQTAKVQVPGSVVIPAGQNSVTTTFTAMDDDFQDGWKDIRITAFGSGLTTAYSWIAVQDDESPPTIQLALPASVTEGETHPLNAQVIMTPPPTANVEMTLTYTNGSEVSGTSAITYSAGRKAVDFTITAIDDALIDGTQNVTVTATAIATGNTVSSNLDVLDNDVPTLALTVPTEVTEGDTAVQGSINIGKITTNPLTINLTSSQTNKLTIPSQVTIPAYNDSATFGIATVDNLTADGTQTVQITADGLGATPTNADVVVHDDDALAFVFGSVPATVARNVPFAVTLSALDAEGHTQTHFNGTVSLTATALGSPLPVTPGTLANFENGVWTGFVTVGESATGAVLFASDAGGATGSSAPFDVVAGTLSSLAVTVSADTVFSDTPFDAVITALDDQGGRVNEVSGSVTATAYGLREIGITGEGSVAFPGMIPAAETSRCQMLLTASELGNASALLKRMSLGLATVAPGGNELRNLTVRLQHTALTEAPSGWLDTGWTTVYAADRTLSGTSFEALPLLFDSSFAYDGTSNLLVDISFSNANPPAGADVYATTKTEPRCLFASAASGDPLTWTGSTPTATLSNDLPNLAFDDLAGQLASQTVTLANGTGTATFSIPGVWSSVFILADGPSLPIPLSAVSEGFPVVEPDQILINDDRIAFCDDFETGSPRAEWDLTGTLNYRTIVTPDYAPHAGNYHLVMDTFSNAAGNSRNEATLMLDLTGHTGTTLSFWMKENSDEDQAPPSNPYTGSADYDGVAISADGNTWYEVQPLRGTASNNTYRAYAIDIDAVMTLNGWNYGPGFRVRFNHFDNSPWPSGDGFAFDDVCIRTLPTTSLALSLPSSLNEGSTASATVTISTAQATDTQIILQSDRAGRISTPAEVTIPAGQTSATFSLTAPEDAVLNGNIAVEIVASVPGVARHDRGHVVFLDNESPTSLQLALPAQLDEGSSIQGTVTMSPAALIDTPVNITVTPATGLTFESGVYILSGQTSADFTIEKPENNLIGEPTTATAAIALGASSDTASFALTDNDPLQPLVISLPATAKESDSPFNGTVGFANPYGAGVDMTVTLSSDTPGSLVVPASVILPAGSSFVEFSVTPVNNTATDGSRDVVISAAISSIGNANATVQVLDEDLHHFTIDPIPTQQVATRPFDLTIRALTLDDTPADITGSPALASSSTSGPLAFTPVTAGPFAVGTWTGPVTFSETGSNVTLTVTEGGVSATSNAFSVADGGRISVAPASITATFPALEPPTEIPIEISNSGDIPLNWSTEVIYSTPPVMPSLEDVLAKLDTNHTAVTDLIPSRYDFAEGTSNYYIVDGGANLYDYGNYISSNAISGYLTYTNGALQTTGSGTGARYFTQKVPGLFVMAADLNGATTFSISGTLGYEVGRVASPTVLSADHAGRQYKGFVKRVHGASIPSVNHLIIVEDNGSLLHSISAGVDNDGQTISGLSSSTRVYYLLFSSEAGGFIDDLQMQTIMDTFLARVASAGWLTTTPDSDTTANGGTPQTMTARLDPTGLTEGTHTAIIRYHSDDPTTPTLDVPVTLHITAPVDHFEWAAVPSPQQANIPFPVSLTAKDAAGNIQTDFNGTANLQVHTQASQHTTGAGSLTTSRPLYTDAYRSRTQCIYTPTEVGGEKSLISMALDVSSIPASNPVAFRVRLKHTDKADFPTSSGLSWETDGWTTVFEGGFSANVIGWNEIPFTQPFQYDGARNLMVDFQVTSSAFSASGIVMGTSSTNYRAVYGYAYYTTDPSTWAGQSPYLYVNNALPNIRFTGYDVSPLSPAFVTFTNGVYAGPIAAPSAGTSATLVALHPSRIEVSGSSNLIDITSAGALTLDVPTPSGPEGGSLNATVSAPTTVGTDLIVSLSSSDVTEANLPATVTIPAGQSSANFTINLTNDTELDGPQSPVVSASAPNYDTARSTIMTEDDEVTTVTVALPASISESAGEIPDGGTITFSHTPTADLTVFLTSSDTQTLTVPASVVLPSGQNSISFPITIVNDSLIEDTATVTVTATLNGSPSGSTSIDVTDDESRTLRIYPFSYTFSEHAGTLSNAGYVQLYGTATTPINITLTSADGTEIANSSCVIDAGDTQGYFSLTILDDSDFDGTQTVLITASSPGFTDGTKSIAVTDDELHHFDLTPIPSTQVRNVPFSFTATAKDVNGVTISDYSGSPTLTASDGTNSIPVTPSSVASFTSGTKSIDATIGTFASNVVMTLTDPTTGGIGTTNAFDVSYGSVHHFDWSVIPSPQTSNIPFPATITAKDIGGNTVTDYGGSTNLSVPSELNIGNGTLSTTFPLYSLAHDNRTQIIYTPTELGGATQFKSLALNVLTTPGQPLNNFTIRMRNTSLSSYGGAPSWEFTGWTTCYQGDVTISSTGWATFPFTTSFNYNGVSHLMIDISFNNTYSTSSGQVQSTSGATITTIYGLSFSNNGDPLTWNASSPTPNTTSARPNIRLGRTSPNTVTPSTTTAFTNGVWSGDIAVSGYSDAIRLRASDTVFSGDSNAFALDNQPQITVTLPSTAGESVGSVAGTISLANAVTTALTITLSSDTPSAASPATTSVVIPAGTTSVPFTLNIVDDIAADGSQSATITASSPGAQTGSNSISVLDDDAHHFVFSTISSPQTAFVPFPITISAKTLDDLPATAFTGSVSLSCDAGGDIPMSPTSTTAFAAGVWTGDIAIHHSGLAATLTADDGAGHTGSSATFDVQSGSVAGFTIAPIPSPRFSNVPIDLTITAIDDNGNPVQDYMGPADLSAISSSSETSVTTGTGTGTSSLPLYASFLRCRSQMIYLPTEIGGAGTLSSIAIDVATIPGRTLNGFTIRLKHTTKANYTGTGNATWETADWTTVYQGDLTVATTGWNTIALQTPFDYNGTENLMVDFSFNDPGVASSGICRVSSAGSTRTLYYVTNTVVTAPTSWSGNTPSGSTNSSITNLRITKFGGLPLTPLTTGSFVNGVWTGTASIAEAGVLAKIVVADGPATASSNIFQVDPPFLAWTAPTQAAEDEGVLSVTLSTPAIAGPGGILISIANDQPGQVTVPATVTIPEGQSSITFDIAVINDSLLDGSQTAHLIASASGITSASHDLIVDDDETATITVSLPTTLDEGQGSVAAAGTITLSAATGADVQIQLASSDETEVTTPATVTLLQGTSSATFPLTAVDDVMIDGSQSVTITATVTGWTTGSSSLSITDDESSTLAITLPASISEGGSSATATITAGGTVVADLTVALSSDDTSELSVPATVIIPAGQASQTFALTPINDALKDGAQTVTVTASSTGFSADTKSTTVKDDDPASFVFTNIPSGRIAGQGFSTTILAKTIDNQPATAFTGTVTLGGINGGIPTSITPATTPPFGAGSAIVSVTIPTAGAAWQISADDGAGNSGLSNVFGVQGGPMTSIEWSSQPTTATKGQPFPVTLTARDSTGGIAYGFNSSAGLTLNASSSSSTTREIGSGAFATTVPLYSFVADERAQIIYTQEEIGGSGVLSSVAVNIKTSTSTVFNNFTLRLRHTPQSDFATSASWEGSGWTEVWRGTHAFNSIGWHTFTFTTPFEYNGVDNLMLDLSFDNSSGATAPTIKNDPTTAMMMIYYYTANGYGDPRTWSGNNVPIYGATNRPHVRFTRTSSAPQLAPTTTGTFSSGIWSGDLTIDEFYPAVTITANDGSGHSGTSAPIDITVAQPIIDAEPPFTGGTTNTIAWTTTLAGTGFEVQADTDPGYVAPQIQQPLTASSADFSNLSDATTYHYRVRSFAPTSSQSIWWDQRTYQDFVACTLMNTSTSIDVNSVTLAATSTSQSVSTENFDEVGTAWGSTIFSEVINGSPSRSNFVLGPNTTPELPVNQGGDIEARLPYNATAITADTPENTFANGSIEAYIANENMGTGASAILMLRATRMSTSTYVGYAAIVNFYTNNTAAVSIGVIINGVQWTMGVPGSSFPMNTNENLKVRFTVNGNQLSAQAWKVVSSGGNIIETPINVSGGQPIMTFTDAALSTGRAAIRSAGTGTSVVLMDDITITKDVPTFANSGTVTSPIIDAGTGGGWGQLKFVADTSAPGTAASVDVLSASDTVLASNIASGTELGSIPAIAATTQIKLRSNLSTTDTASSPRLRLWSLPHAPAIPPSPWSATVTSTQDATAPDITFNSPGDQFTTLSSYNITGTSSDATSGIASLTVNGQPANTSDAFAHWVGPVNGLTAGAHTFAVTATDKAVPPNTTTVDYHLFRIITPSGDSDGNGLKDIAQHAFNLDAPGVGRSGLPQVVLQTQPSDGKKYLMLQFRRRIQPGGFRYIVETSEDLTPPWDDSGADVTEVSADPTGDGVTELVTVKVTPDTTSTPRKFIRLRIELD